MTSTSPIEQRERTVIVDIIRGFALVGVLIANFTGYIDQQVPEPLLESISSPIDKLLMRFNTVFLQWKFMTLFSILFGYGFGLILESLERKNINPNPFFAKRMFWLIIFGVIHCLFWWGDVLNLYAMSGIILLLYKRKSNNFILISSLCFMFLIPALISYLFRNLPETFTAADIQEIYIQYKKSKLIDLFIFNIDLYNRMFILSGANVHDIIETLGRFLFGYYLLRNNLFQNIERKKKLFVQILVIVSPFVIMYFIFRWMLLNNTIHMNKFIASPVLSIGILATTTCYVCLLVIAYMRFGMNRFFKSLQSLGKMTLSNYMMISVFLVLLLYGIGLNQLGEISLHTIWIMAAGWLLFEIILSDYWLKKFRYGPLEWIWRQLTYWKRLPLKK